MEGRETNEERAQRRKQVLEMILWPRAYATIPVEIGGDPAKINQHGETPLHIAARTGRSSHLFTALKLRTASQSSRPFVGTHVLQRGARQGAALVG